MKLEEIIILIIGAFGLITVLFVIWTLGNLTSQFNVPRQKRNSKKTKESKIVRYVMDNLLKLIAIISYSILLYVLVRNNYLSNKPIELISLIRISAVLLTIFIGYLFAKLFQVRKEKIEDQKIIADYSDKLTGYRRFIFYVLSTDDFWKTKVKFQLLGISIQR